MLIKDLFISRLSEKTTATDMIMDPTPLKETDRSIVSDFQTNDPTVGEAVVVKEWLEQCMPPVEPLEIRSSIWPFTLREVEAALNRGEMPSVVHEFDPDGCFREGKLLHLEDIVSVMRFSLWHAAHL